MKINTLLYLPLLLLCGCAMNPAIVVPNYLDNSPRYTIEGRQGFMPGRHITFAHFQGEVDKSWLNHHNVRLLVDTLLDTPEEKVSIKQTGPKGEQISMDYQQVCDWHQLSQIVGTPRFDGTLHVKDQTWKFINPMLIRHGDQRLSIDVNEHAVRLNHQVIAEYRLSVSKGFFSMADYVWLDEKQPANIQLIAAILVTYAVTYEHLKCQS